MEMPVAELIRGWDQRADDTAEKTCRKLLAQGPGRMTPKAQGMIEHIVGLIRKPNVTIDENTPLVSSRAD